MVEINVSQFVKECRKLRIVLADEKADPDILAECDNVITDATEPLMIMVMGEFSTGKSSFINALLGKDVTVVNATPTTAVITKLRYGRQEKVIVHYKDGRTEEQGVEEFARLSAQGDAKANAFHRKLSFVERVLPLKILKDLTIIDSPGLNSLVESHTQATKSFMGKADVVFWMFSVEDPVSQTELDAMRRLGARLKPVALVNKMDTIDEEEDDPDELLEQIRIKLEDQVQTVIGISAKTALDLLAKNPKADLTESGLPEVEGYIEEEILPNRGKYKMETMVDDMSGLMLNILNNIASKEKAIISQKSQDYAAYMEAKEHITSVRDQLSATTLEIYEYVQTKPVKNSTDLLFLSFLYQHGFIVNHDQKKQDEYLEQAALKKDANAQAYFGIQLLSENSPEKAMYWLKKSLNQGNDKAKKAIEEYQLQKQRTLQKKEQNQRMTTKKENEAICSNVSHGVSAGLIAGPLGGMLEEFWKKKFPEIENRVNQQKERLHFVVNAIEKKEHLTEAFSACTDLADENFVKAFFYLGQMYEEGLGTSKDYNKAAKWYRKGAEAGNAWAMNSLGECYHEGAGVARDYNEAVEWFRKAVRAGDDWAMTNLGYCYEHGEGVARDYNKAAELFKKGAEAGNSWAINDLGNCYYYGRGGVPKNVEKAVELYKRAEALGCPEATQSLKTINRGCFITTAVCNSFAKPDDCYELQSFRAFRDGWLRVQPDGAALIDEYYRVAPPIVEEIDAQPDAPRIYQRIWEKYLQPCLHDIEQKKYLSCKNRYVAMVRSLERMFCS